MKHLLRRAVPYLLATAVAVSLAIPAGAAKPADVKVTNRTDWEIHELYLSPVDDENWGPDQLRDEVIGKDESFTLVGVPCDEYDVKIVDEDDDACIVAQVDICGENHQWTITSDDLLQCEAASAAE
ncbi:MAG TPA: hypothetical protein VFS60_15590 [Thermoanaerobaculia bacterium]|nr:hypothetical protein [Thermoanaerobaculia bacterium]